MQIKTQGRGIRICFAFLAAAIAASATAITVANPSFESPLQSPGGFTTGTITSWTTSGVQGVFQPTASQLVPITGIQVGYSNTGPVSQVLTALLTANTVYTLTTDFLARKDACCPWLGSELDLMAGNTILGSSFIASLAPGGIQTSTVSFTALPANPNLGLALQIRITTTGSGGGQQIDFDNVQLDGSPLATSGVPEPGSVWLFAGAGILLATFKKYAAIRSAKHSS